MKVLWVSDVYFPRINGVSTSIETFRAGLAGQGVQVQLIAPAYRDEPPEDGILRIPARVVPRDPEDRLMSYRAVVSRAPALAAQGFGLVHVHTPFVAHYAGLALARRLGVPCIATYHTYFEEYLHHYLPFLPRAASRALARRFSRRQCNALDALVVPSRPMAEVLQDYGVTQPLHVLPTGLPASRFAQGDGASFRRALGIPATRPVALFVGRIAFEKNIGFLLQVIRRVRREIPDVLLLLAGEGPALPALRQQAASLGLAEHCRFIGYLDRNGALQDCYRAADAFVFASRTETQGLVLLEAMALGVPVVALAALGTADVLRPEAGALVPRDDVADFAQALAGLLRDPARRAAMAEQHRAYARQWSSEALAGRLAQLYRDLAAARRAAAPLPAAV